MALFLVFFLFFFHFYQFWWHFSPKPLLISSSGVCAFHDGAGRCSFSSASACPFCCEAHFKWNGWKAAIDVKMVKYGKSTLFPSRHFPHLNSLESLNCGLQLDLTCIVVQVVQTCLERGSMWWILFCFQTSLVFVI